MQKEVSEMACNLEKKKEVPAEDELHLLWLEESLGLVRLGSKRHHEFLNITPTADENDPAMLTNERSSCT